MPKERTKGQKEIYKDNQEILVFYLKFSVVATVIHVVHTTILGWIFSSLSLWNVFWLLFGLVHHIGANYMLRFLSKATLGTKGEVLDAGTDISNSFISEYSKDVIIFTSILQLVSAISLKLWFFWVIGPGYICYKLWKAIIWPWFIAGSELLKDERKKNKKPKQKTRKIH